MRTSFFSAAFLVVLALLVLRADEAFSQSIEAGEYYGVRNQIPSITRLVLSPDGTFEISFTDGEHGSPPGKGDWTVVDDSLHLTFDDESLKVKEEVGSTYTIVPVEATAHPDSLHFIITVRGRNDPNPVSETRILIKTENSGVISKFTDKQGQTTLSLPTNAAHQNLGIDLSGYKRAIIPLKELEGSVFSVVVTFEGMSDPFGYPGPVSKTRTWMLGISESDQGELILSSKDESKRIRILN